jgi:hypothetical protein
MNDKVAITYILQNAEGVKVSGWFESERPWNPLLMCDQDAVKDFFPSRLQMFCVNHKNGQLTWVAPEDETVDEGDAASALLRAFQGYGVDEDLIDLPNGTHWIQGEWDMGKVAKRFLELWEKKE